ncbi:MAG: class I SAM-dependent methyltransferase [Myxococcota bacterium]
MTESSPGAPRALDGDKLKQTARLVFDALGGAMTSLMIHLGDRLGLYRALAGGQSVGSRDLAARTGLDERWVREWLYQQGAAGVLEHEGDGRFSLSAEAEAVLADESHPAFGAGYFDALPKQLATADRLPTCFETGLGLPYDAHGAEGARGIERGLAPWFRTLLVPLALPRVEGVVEELEAGIPVADVGCGAGVALLEMARAYPKSEFHGYDISHHALERARQNARAAGVENVRFHDAVAEPLPEDGRFRFVTTFDCLHDMTHPGRVIAGIRRALADDGTWLVADIKAHPTYEANVSQNPMAPLMYGMSILTCMSSALSEPDGQGLGTLGLHAALLEAMAQEAGFTRFEPLELGHPVNAFYVVRP